MSGFKAGVREGRSPIDKARKEDATMVGICKSTLVRAVIMKRLSEI